MSGKTDILTKFKKLNLHSEPHGSPDNETMPFVATAKVRIDDRKTLLGCSFNPYIAADDEQILAAVGSQWVHVFGLPKDANVVNPLWSCSLVAAEEDLFTVAWCFDTYEASRGSNPYKIITGGLRGQIYIIDTYTRKLCNFQRMQFAGGSINDLRTCPTNSNLVACGSKDATIRIFHIRNQDFLVTMGGLDGHVGQVLSVDWAGTGDYIMSCGFDHQIMKWDLTKPHVKKHLEAACKLLESGDQNVITQSTPLPEYEDPIEPAKIEPKSSVTLESYAPNAVDMKVIEDATGLLRRPPGSFLPIYYPDAVCSDLHVDYVDCVRTLGTSNYIFSKACGRESAICLWRFGAPKGTIEKEPLHGVTATTATRLATTEVPSGDAWFCKFEIDPTNSWLAAGSTCGLVSIYNLKKPGDKPVISVCVAGKIIRQTSFSSDGRILVAVEEQGSIIRFDRVPASVDPKPFAKYINHR